MIKFVGFLYDFRYVFFCNVSGTPHFFFLLKVFHLWFDVVNVFNDCLLRFVSNNDAKHV